MLPLLLAACAPLSRHEPRLAPTSLACMRAVVKQYVPAQADDILKHCLAAGFIARRCSVSEAKLASWGKELADAFDGGDPSTADLRADRAGIECAQHSKDAAELDQCCARTAMPALP